MQLKIGSEVQPTHEGVKNNSRLYFGGMWGILLAYGVGDYRFVKVLIHGQVKPKWFPTEYWKAREHNYDPNSKLASLPAIPVQPESAKERGAQKQH